MLRDLDDGILVAVNGSKETLKEKEEMGRNLVALPSDGGESVDHALGAVELAHEVRRIAAHPGV